MSSRAPGAALSGILQPSKAAVYTGVALLVLLTAAWHGVSQGEPVFPVDDAYITLHSAQVLFHGSDPRYVGSPALAGATSPFHVVVSSVLLTVFSPLWAHWVSAWLGALAYALALTRLAFVIGAGPFEALLVVGTGMLIGETPHQLLNGLETGWAMAAVTWALAALCDRAPVRRWALPLGCGVLPFVRPELIALSGLLLLMREWDTWRQSSDRGQFAACLSQDAAWFLAGAAPFMALTWWNTGSPVVGTIAAKRNYFAQACAPLAVKRAVTKDYLWQFGFMMAPLSLMTPLLFFNRVGRAVLMFGVTLVGAYFMNFPSALGQYEQRYLYVLVPGLMLAPLVALSARQSTVRLGGSVLLMIGFAYAGVNAKAHWAQQVRFQEFTRHELVPAGEWLEQRAAADDVVLIHDAGYVSYTGQYKLVDLVGLKTPASLKPHAEITWPSCGTRRNDAIAEIALASKPRFMVVRDTWEKGFLLTKGLTRHGWSVTLRKPGAYAIYELAPPAAAN